MTLALAIPVPIMLIGLWQLAVQQGWVANLSEPREVGADVVELLQGKTAFDAGLWDHVLASTRRVLTGFLLGCVLAIPLGVLMGRSRGLSALLDPTISLLRPVPVTAWAPLMVVIVGIGSKSATILIFIASFFPVLLNTIAGVKAVPPRLLEAAAMLGTKPHRVLARVVLPAALPSVFTGMRVALGLAWVVVVVGETVGVQTGLGSLIEQAKQVSRTDMIITGMLFIGLAGFLSDKAMSALMRLALRNRPLLDN
jgi:NitT/TauT family transport system permease protein